jgi:[ribosomal protein S5]-alanine N-acetyltransferase
MPADTLTGKRIRLAPLTVAHVTDAYVGWLNDPLVNRYLEVRFARHDRASVAAFVARVDASDDEHLFGIFLREDGRHIGNIKIGPVSARHGVGEVSLLIGERDFWGRAPATDAIHTVSRHGFDTLGVRKLTAGVYASNAGSAAAFQRVGYREEGRRRRHYLSDSGPCDLLLYGLFPDELAAQPYSSRRTG